MNLESILLAHEPSVRLGCTLLVLTVVVGLELKVPRRRLSQSRLRRWASNAGLAVIGVLMLRLLLPMLAVGAALFAAEAQLGLLNLLPLPLWLQLLIAVLALDAIIYCQHRLFHAIPVLWRLHRVHHADLDFDVSTGLRFHPLEIVLSMLIKIGCVIALGAPAVAVIVFEMLLGATSLFNHGNFELPSKLDRWLRWGIVTPDMHRVHHSVVEHETNANFGFNLPWWDRLLGTYRAQPAAGHQAMEIGLLALRDPRECIGLTKLLVLPLADLRAATNDSPNAMPR